MKINRIFVLLCILLISGCSIPADRNASSLEEASVQPEYSTLIWWTLGPEPVDYAIGMEHINDYLEENMGLHLDMRMLPWQELITKSLELVNSGEYFDIMFLDAENYNPLSTLGAFQDITDMVRVSAPELWDYIPPLIWSGTKLGGRIYAVPAYKDSALAQYLVFDRMLADSCGITVSSIQDWVDLDTALMKVKQIRGKDYYPLLLSRNDRFGGMSNGYDSISSGLPIIGVRLDDPDKKVVCLLEEEEYVERLQMLRKWYLNGIINPDANVIAEVSKPRPIFSAVGWPGAESIWEQNEGVESYVTQLLYGPVYTSESIQGSLNAISVQSTKKQEALQLLERINLDPVLRDMLAYGIEGVHFEYVSEGVVRKLNHNWTVPAFSQGTFFTMSVIEDTTAEEGRSAVGEVIDHWTPVKKQNNMAEKSVLLGFSMDIQELSTELSACRAVWNRYMVDFGTGAIDPEVAIPKCLEELREAGLDIILSEAQKQINRFNND